MGWVIAEWAIALRLTSSLSGLGRTRLNGVSSNKFSAMDMQHFHNTATNPLVH